MSNELSPRAMQVLQIIFWLLEDEVESDLVLITEALDCEVREVDGALAELEREGFLELGEGVRMQ